MRLASLGHRLTRRRPFGTALLYAVAFGAAAASLSIVKALVFAPLPYPNANRLVALRIAGPSWSPALLESFTQHSRAFDLIAGIQERAASLDTGAGPEPVRLEAVSASYFPMLGAGAAVGRPFHTDEDRRGELRLVAVISHGLWHRLFGGRPDVISSTLVVDGRRIEIVGVMRPGFRGLIGRTDVWVPLSASRAFAGLDTQPERPSSRWFEVIARARDGLTHEEAAAAFAAEGQPAVEAIPGWRTMFSHPAYQVIPLRGVRATAVLERAGWILTGGAALLLVLVATTAVSLQLANLLSRDRELAIRRAVGATTSTLVRMIALDALIPVAVGVAGGLLVRRWLLDALLTLQPPAGTFGLASAEALTPEALALDLPILVTLALTALAIWTMTGLWPAVRASRAILSGLRATPASSTGVTGLARLHRSFPYGSALIVSQLAVTATVLVGACVMAKSSWRIAARDRGFDPDATATLRITPPPRYSPDMSARFYAAIAHDLSTVPGIDVAAVASCAPGAGRCRRSSVQRIDGQPLADGHRFTFGVHFATPAFVGAIGGRITAGREFATTDTAGSTPVALVSESAAARMWPGQSPLGRRVSMYFADGRFTEDREVVGVIRDLEYDSVEASPPGDIYFPAAQAAWEGLIFARTRLAPSEVLAAARQVARGIDSTVLLQDAQTLRQRLATGLANERFVTSALMGFAAAAILVGALGTYALVSVTLSRKRRDIGISLALGCPRGRIRRSFVGQALLLSAGAAAIGLTASFWLVNVLAALAHDTSPRDPWSFAGAALILLCVGAAAAAYPAWRASRLDPSEMLRST